jgi:hypothetical protein
MTTLSKKIKIFLELKTRKEMEKTTLVLGTVVSTQDDTSFVFCISFLVFNYENILTLGDSEVGSHL